MSNPSEAKLYQQQNSQTAEAIAETVNTGVQVAAAVAETVSDTSKDNETKAQEVTQVAASVIEQIPSVAPFAPVIAVGVELEPEIYHGISALIHFFQKAHRAKQPAGK